MANPIYYYDGIEDATLAYSATEDTDFTVENLKNRNKNTFFKDTAIAAATVNLVIDFGAARSCDSIVLGNYIATAVIRANLKLEAHSADAWVGAQTEIFADQDIHTTTLDDDAVAFSAQSFRYWRLVFDDSLGNNLTDLQIAIILLGTKLSHTVNRNWGMHESRLSNVSSRMTKGGQDFTNKNGENKRVFSMNWADIEETQKDNIMTWLETVFNNYLPFYLDINGDGNEILVRKQAPQGGVQDKDFQVYDTDRLTLVEVL